MSTKQTNEAPTRGDSGSPRDPAFFRNWIELGRRVERVAARTAPGSLPHLLLEAERLIVQTVWRALGDNLSHVAGYLQVSRKRIRDALDEVRVSRPAPRRGEGSSAHPRPTEPTANARPS
ncbi:MAG: hypothetical protein H6712_22490 [Myxococcales bacterium]|nr:hypothetical protein [Myxococcales bacterium]MCB9716644.1 hypothetical protein [Myxococcales bacterium]